MKEQRVTPEQFSILRAAILELEAKGYGPVLCAFEACKRAGIKPPGMFEPVEIVVDRVDAVMRKRTSLRRWKARCRCGRWIPKTAIIDYGLMRWFNFAHRHYASEHYRAELP
jgi:hypothetical protein